MTCLGFARADRNSHPMKTYAAAFVFTMLFAVTAPDPTLASHHGSHVVVPLGQSAPRVGPGYLYPDPETTPGVTNPEVTQANIQQTICVRGWTATIRPPASYTNTQKKQQLQAVRFTDKNPAHYEEDHFISLELGGNPGDPKNLWPEMWGTPGHSIDLSWTLSAVTRRRQGKGQNRDGSEHGCLPWHSVKQSGVIQLRSWGAHAPAASGAGSHPLGLGAMSPGNFAIPGTGDFAIKCMVPRPRKTNVNNAITSRLSNFVNAIKSRLSNLGIAHPYARRVMRLRVLQMCGGRAISSTPQDMHSGRAGEVIQLRAWGAHERVAVKRG